MHSSFKVIPVLDIMNGVVVQGVAGRRDEYLPIDSQLVGSSDARDVAHAIRDQLGLDYLYIADLDSIVREKPNLDLLGDLVDSGFRLLVDAGIREADQIGQLMNIGVEDVIIALETTNGPSVVGESTARYPSDRIVFSVDQKDGRLMGDDSNWDLPDWSAEWMARAVIELGIGRIILLDLAGVGMGQGVTTLELSRNMSRSYPNVEIITGGGVRTMDDLTGLKAAGVSGVLVSTAIQQGQLTREQIEEITKS